MAAEAERVIIVADGAVEAGLLGTLFAARAAPARAASARDEVAGGDAGGRPRLIAADGGAAKVLRAGLVPDLVIGDGDSLSPDDRARLAALGVELRLAEPDKDESDTELCVMAALAEGARAVTIVGAFGEIRPEHTVANLLMLADRRLDDVDVEIVTAGARLTRIGTADGPGAIDIDGRHGDFVSLFPMGAAVHGVSTAGLRFPLHDATLELGRSRGLSNELLDGHARVTTERGCLLVVHTYDGAAAIAETEADEGG